MSLLQSSSGTGIGKRLPRRRPRLRRPGLQGRFQLALAGLLLVFCVFSALLVYRYELSMLEGESFRQTELVMVAVSSARKYVQEILRPRIREVVGQEEFIVEAMSTSFVSRQVMEFFRDDMPEFQYRRVSLGARNPLFEADETERRMIEHFQARPDEQDWRGIMALEGGRYFMRFSPVVFTEECMLCHGEPENAPAYLVQRYGREGGFHRRPGMVEGVVSIAIPVEHGLARIREMTVTIFGTAFLLMILLYVAITFFFNRLIVHNLRGMLALFWGNLSDDKGRELLERTRTMDEIGELNTAAEIMAGHLQEVQADLRDHVENLEEKVANRTRALKEMARLLQDKELLQTVFDGITDLVVLMDSQGRVLMVNRALRERYGLPESELLGLEIGDLAERYPEPFAAFARIAAVPLRESYSDEITLGATSFAVYFFPVSGAREGVVGYAKDVTGQKVSERRMQQAEKMAAIGQLASGVAHEINNPLGAIICYLDLLREDLQDMPAQLADLEVIAKNVRFCQGIVAGLLGFARRRPAEKKPTVWAEVIDEVVATVSHQIRQKGIALEVEQEPDLPRLNIDRDKMRQVLLNLLLNAIQACETADQHAAPALGSCRIKVATRYNREQEMVETVVADEGVGIAAEHLDKIFEPFFSTKEQGKGTGLGLSLSYGFVSEHDGDILVESRPGQGSRFTVILPVTTRERQRNG
jgi:two-component system, NtrC family, sensor kinase